jgi:hypothetical protein
MPVPTYDGGYRFDRGWYYDRADQPLPDSGVAGETKMAKIKIDIYHLTIAAFIVTLKAIIGKMTGNATFTSQAAKLTAVSTTTATLEAAQTAYLGAKQEADGKLAELYVAQAAAQEALRELATGVESVSHDAAVLLAAGWDLQAERSPVGPMPKVLNLAATGGDMDGSVDLGWAPVKRGLQTYLARYGTAANGPFTQFYAGKASKCTAEGLVSGTEYWFEVCAVGAAGPGPWSDPARMRAT